jgi:hypothetical protein
LNEKKSALDPGRVPRLGLLLLLLFFSCTQAYHIFLAVKFDSSAANEPRNQGATETDFAKGNLQNISVGYGLSGEEKYKAHSEKENYFASKIIMRLPVELSFYANTTDQPRKRSEKPVFWHIPRAGGGSIVKKMASQCLKLVQASEVGAVVNPQASVIKELLVTTDVFSGASFINVDTTLDKGIKRAKELGLGKSNLVDLIVVSNIYEAGTLFDPLHKGRLFTIMRHPIQRAVSVYYAMKDAAKSDVKIKTFLKGMSLEQYASSKIVENNWMTRFLSNKLGGELTSHEEALAREVLAQKFIIGLLSEKQQSIDRFIRYFGWTTNDQSAEACIDEIVGWKWLSRASGHPEVKENGRIWRLLGEQNAFDMRLYNYAEELFRAQSFFFD